MNNNLILGELKITERIDKIKKKKVCTHKDEVDMAKLWEKLGYIRVRKNQYSVGGIYFWNAAAAFWRLRYKTTSNKNYLRAVKNLRNAAS